MSHAATLGQRPALTPSQKRMFRGAFYLFVLAEALIFVTLFSTRFLLSGTGHPSSVNTTLGLSVTALLVVSLAPLSLALSRVRRGKRGAGLLRLTALFGLVALALIAYDLATLTFDVGSRYGENYVLSTFFHAVHIVFGLVALAVMAGADGRGEYRPENHWPVEAATVFWWFVVVSWGVLYVVFFAL